MRFGIYAATQDKIGFGSSELSKHAKEMGEALNPDKTMVDLKAFSTSVNFSLSAGFRYIIFYKPVFLVFAVGYDLEGAGIVTFGGAADTSSDLGYNPDFLYLNHGLSFKLYMSWVGRE